MHLVSRQGFARRWAVLLWLLMVSFVVAGCGGAGSNQSGQPSNPAEQPKPQPAAPSSQPAPNTSADTSAQLVEAAKKEGKVVWYTAVSLEAAERVGKLFEEKYGIKVDVVRSGSERVF